jgi:hypothetical protein
LLLLDRLHHELGINVLAGGLGESLAEKNTTTTARDKTQSEK